MIYMSCLLLILVCELLTEFQLQLFNDVDRTHYKERTLRNVFTVSVWVSSVTSLYCHCFNVSNYALHLSIPLLPYL